MSTLQVRSTWDPLDEFQPERVPASSSLPFPLPCPALPCCPAALLPYYPTLQPQLLPAPALVAPSLARLGTVRGRTLSAGTPSVCRSLLHGGQKKKLWNPMIPGRAAVASSCTPLSPIRSTRSRGTSVPVRMDVRTRAGGAICCRTPPPRPFTHAPLPTSLPPLVVPESSE